MSFLTYIKAFTIPKIYYFILQSILLYIFYYTYVDTLYIVYTLYCVYIVLKCIMYYCIILFKHTCKLRFLLVQLQLTSKVQLNLHCCYRLTLGESWVTLPDSVLLYVCTCLLLSESTPCWHINKHTQTYRHTCTSFLAWYMIKEAGTRFKSQMGESLHVWHLIIHVTNCASNSLWSIILTHKINR